MLSAFGRVISLIILLCISSSICINQYEPPEQSLYIADSRQAHDNVHSINRHQHIGSNAVLQRRARDVSTTETPRSPSDEMNISKWISHLNVSHPQLLVHYVGNGSEVIMCLAKDYPRTHNGSILPSALFISYNYGKNYTNKTESFRLGDELDSGYAILDYSHNHPILHKSFVFTDETNKKLFYTDDSGKNIHRIDLRFHPSVFIFDDNSSEKYVILDKIDSNRKLYLTLDGGKTFKMIQSNVKMFHWCFDESSSNMFYIEREESDGTITILSASDPTELDNAEVVIDRAREFQIKKDFIFATKESTEPDTFDLYISYKRASFYKAVFQTELSLRKFHIADVTDNIIFVTVMHNATVVHLYVSEISHNFTEYDFILSLEQIMSYFPGATWKDTQFPTVIDKTFTDLYRVNGLSGIYIASCVDSEAGVTNIKAVHLKSVITFDHGITWSPINSTEKDENGNFLRLNLCQGFCQLQSRLQGIMSSKSAPGIIMATGISGTSLNGSHAFYLSKDAGFTWEFMSQDIYLYNYGDHGGILVLVKYFIHHGITREIYYSTNEGMKWNSYQFNAEYYNIYGFMNEQGENSTTFTMFGSAEGPHQWVIITVDFKNIFARNCTNSDYEYWSPAPTNSTRTCVLGARKRFQRRLADANCYNGINYDRPFTKEPCQCNRQDFECDFGFKLSGNKCVRNKSENHDPYAVPSDCRPGNFYEKTKGYIKIYGDVCTVSDVIPYTPDKIPCPIKESNEFMLIALGNKIGHMDLLHNSTIYPIVNQTDIISIEFDMKNNCVFYASLKLNKINRQCFNKGMSEEVLVDTDLTTIEDMAFDWVSNVLFFVSNLNKKIEAIKTDTTLADRMRVTILNSRLLYSPRGLAVHPKEGYLFWTDWHSINASISRSNLDGTNVQKLFGKPIVSWPNGITIDYISERIFWVDAKIDYIASADLNGRDFKKIIWSKDRVAHPYAITISKDKMFWGDWHFKSIFSADKESGENITIIDKYTIPIFRLKAFSHTILEHKNPCSYKNITCDGICLGKPRNSYICLCPKGLHNVNGKCMCDNNIKPFTNMTCPQKNSTCDADDFMCENGNCVRNSQRCNGNNDCGDMSDEISCPCKPPLLTCDNNLCYNMTKKCDGVVDCTDQSDEKDCRTSHANVTEENVRKCPTNYFQCDNGMCIRTLWLCDTDTDCADGSDERNCDSQSDRPANAFNSARQFCCSDHKCILNTYLCDGDRDCKDGEDENEQLCKESNCTLTQTRCSNGRCIPTHWRCDGQNDCGDYSDERDCIAASSLKPDNQDNSKSFTCAPYTILCGSGECIPKQWVCDGDADCDDASDEKNCSFAKTQPTESPPCPLHLFRCPNGRCLFKSWVCDGYNHCGDEDASDEKNCDQTTTPIVPTRLSSISTTEQPRKIICSDWLFNCDNTCVPLWSKCDGMKDCSDGSDEIDCPTFDETNATTDHPVTPSKCEKEFFACASGVCIPQQKLCDNVTDCMDAEDERDCIGKGVAIYDVVTPICRQDTTLCRDGTVCVYNVNICDGVTHCADKSDEQNCPYIPLITGTDTRTSKLDLWNSSFASSNFEVKLETAKLRRINSTAVQLKWRLIPDVDEINIFPRVPPNYARLEFITTKTSTVTLANLPSGIPMYVDVQTQIRGQQQKLFAIPLHTEGIKDEIINFTAVLSKQKITTVNVTWSPPNSDRYMGKELQYEVHYDLKFNETKVITNSTSLLIENLKPCKIYKFTVGILGGPLAEVLDIFTGDDNKGASVRNLRVEYSDDMSHMYTHWDANCKVLGTRLVYALNVTELTNKTNSYYVVPSSNNLTVSHVITQTQLGAKYNICVHVNVRDAEINCIQSHAIRLQPPSGVKAWLLPNEYVMVMWDDRKQDSSINYKYEVIVSPTAIPEDLLHPTEDMKSIKVEKSPCLMTVPDRTKDVLHVAVRMVTVDGIHSKTVIVNSTDLKASSLLTKLFF